jgi:hypothetical protein
VITPSMHAIEHCTTVDIPLPSVATVVPAPGLHRQYQIH